MSNFWEWSKDVSFVNRFIFPAPKPSSYNKDSFPEELLFVPPKEKLYKYYKQFKMEEANKSQGIATTNNQFDITSPRYTHSSSSKPHSSSSHSSSAPNLNLNADESKSNANANANERKQQYCDEMAIPCIYIERKYRLSEATHLLLYLHGNAEDLGKCYPIIDYIRMKLPVNIIAPEYPGYGIAAGDSCETSVGEMVQNVYEFAISPYGLNVPPSRIIIYGFSIGSAAALSTSLFELNRVYLPDGYITADSKQSSPSNKSNNPLLSQNEEQKESASSNPSYSALSNLSNKANAKNSDTPKSSKSAHHSLLQYRKEQEANLSRRYFLSTFLKRCPHKEYEHEILFSRDEELHCFYSSDINDRDNGDPFERLPLASVLNILRKGKVSYPTSVNKQTLLAVARKHGLIPPVTACKAANAIRKYSLLIIVCPFASISQLVADKIGVFASYLLSERFRNIEAVKKVHGSLLIIHGKEDSIIPFQHSIELHEMAQKCEVQPVHLELLEGCDHNTMDLRKITNIINKFFKHQFNLCRSQKRIHHHQFPQPQGAQNDPSSMNGYLSGDDSPGHTPHSVKLSNGMPYPKTQHNNGRKLTEFVVKTPSYCWLKPEQEAEELAEEDQLRLKKKQEQDDEEYAFNLFMKQLLQHESMQNASASHLKQQQRMKLGKFFGDGTNVVPSSNGSESIPLSGDTDSAHVDLQHGDEVQGKQPEYSLSQALQLQPEHDSVDIVLPPPDSPDNM